MAENYAIPSGDQSDAALEKLYDRVLAGHGMSKRTYRNRLTALDDILIEEIDKRFSGPISVHDMAASSAITSVELFQRLSASRPVTVRASDWHDAVYLVGNIALDASGQRLKRNLPSSLAWVAHRFGLSRRVSFFHPEALLLAQANPNFRLAREDFFSPLLARHDVVRVMNALTELNFPRRAIEAALRVIKPTVKDGGLLVLGRCDDNDNHIQAAIFAKNAGRFSILRELGGGYPLADAVTGVDCVIS